MKRESLKGQSSATLEPIPTSCPSNLQACSANLWRAMHHVKNSTQCIHILDSLHISLEDLKVGFSVVSLLTRVPIWKAQNLLSRHFEEGILAYSNTSLTLQTSALVEKFPSRLTGWLWDHNCLLLLSSSLWKILRTEASDSQASLLVPVQG